MYGTLQNGTMIPAPRKIVIGDWVILNPTDEQYAEAGYLPVIRTDPPEAPEGFYPVSGWEEQDGSIVQVWHLEEMPEPDSAPRAWDIRQGEYINEGERVSSDGVVYECISPHYAAWNKQPPNNEYWKEV